MRIVNGHFAGGKKKKTNIDKLIVCLLRNDEFNEVITISKKLKHIIHNQ